MKGINTVKVNYQLTIYNKKNNCKITRTEEMTDLFEDNTLFPKMIESIIRKNKIKCSRIHVENLKSNTWGSILDQKIIEYMDGNDFYYEWFQYELRDIQNKFKLFDKTINIIIDAPGQGGYVGEQNGIKFIIHSNEKDRHEHEPHIHCIYAGEEMRVRIDTLEIMKKDKELKNKKKVKIAIKWIKENQKELLKYYNCFAIQGNDNIKFEAYI